MTADTDRTFDDSVPAAAQHTSATGGCDDGAARVDVSIAAIGEPQRAFREQAAAAKVRMATAAAAGC
jgi:hypothetical protein